VRVLSVAAGRAVGALRPEVVLPVLAGTAAILVLIPPRILGHSLFEVGTVPIVYIRVPIERVEPLPGVRIAADVEPILIQRRPEQLDLRPRRRLLRLTNPPEKPRPHKPNQHPQHNDDDEKLDQREPPLI